MSTKKKVMQLDDAKASMGKIIRVWNTKRKKFSNAKRHYNAVWVQDQNGRNERCWLLTDKDIERLDYRSERNKEDWTDRGFWNDLLD